jgi:hypothetical protein
MSIRHFKKTSVLITTVIATSFVLTLSEPAFARIKGPALDSFSAGCLALQTAGDQLIAEYKNASNARREEILQQLRNNGRTWREIGCQAVFGDISRLVLTPGGLRNGITWDMLNQSSSGGSGAKHDDSPKEPETGGTAGDVFLY